MTDYKIPPHRGGADTAVGTQAAVAGGATVAGAARPGCTAAEWAALRAGVSGDIVLPGDDDYDRARSLADLEFNSVRPAAVVFCASVADVAAAIRFARRHRLPAVPRSGGHSFAGYSTTTGMVIDVSRLNSVTIDGDVIHVQAGAQIIDIYDQTLPYGLVVPTGWCPNVGIAGLTLGGGVGLEARKHGLTCDNLLAAEVVLADGRIVRCDERSLPDLFWALRGGGGGNFGIVTSLTFRPVPVGDMTTYSLSWRWSDAAAVIDAWQRWAPGTPDDMTPVMAISLPDAAVSVEPTLSVTGAWLSAPEDLTVLLGELITRTGISPLERSQQTSTYRDGLMQWLDCAEMTVTESHMVGYGPDAKLPRVNFGRARGSFFQEAIPMDGITAILQAFRERPQPRQPRNMEFLTLGGAVNRVPSDATAFVHRNCLFYLGFHTGSLGEITESERTAAITWVDSCWATMQPWATPFAYQNFVDPELPDWRNSYYGTNYPRLAQVRSKYDPDHFFLFPQAIT